VKRGVFDTLRRGLDNTIANWQILLLRIGEALLFGVIVIVALIALIVPIVLSLGIRLANLTTPEDLGGLAEILVDQWVIFAWMIAGAFALLLLFMLIHSFVEAGCARIAVDADRVAGPSMEGHRSRFRVFSMERWMAGAMDGGWALFAIYNIAWGVAGLFMLIPLLPTIAVMLLFQETPEVAIATGCAGLVVSVMFIVVVAIVTGIWCTRAIAGWAARRQGASDALRSAWRAMRLDLARHILIALAVFVIAVAGSSFFSSFSFFAGLGESMHRSMFHIVTMPIRLASSIVSSAFSALMSTWFLAAYAALAVEE